MKHEIEFVRDFDVNLWMGEDAEPIKVYRGERMIVSLHPRVVGGLELATLRGVHRIEGSGEIRDLPYAFFTFNLSSRDTPK